MDLTLPVNSIARPASRQIIFMLIMLCSVLLALLRFNTIPAGSFFDDAHYLVLAESLATGRGYRLINYSFAPLEKAFPPGWPLLLTPIALIAPGDLVLPRVLSFLFWIASLPLVYRLFANRLRSPYLEMLLVLVAINPHLVGMAGTALSESAFFFFCLATLNLLHVWRQNQTRRTAVFAALIIMIAFYTVVIRTTGISLFLTVLFYLLLSLWRSQRIYLVIMGGIVLMALVPLSWFNGQSGGGYIFSPLYTQHVQTVFLQLGHYLRFWEHFSNVSTFSIADAMIPVFELTRARTLLGEELSYQLSLLLLLLILIGFLRSARRAEPMDLHVGLYLAIFYLWTVYIGEVQIRQLLPILPFLYFYLLQAVTLVTGPLARGHNKLPVYMPLGIVCLLLLLSAARNYHEWRNPIAARVMHFTVGASWIRENSAEDAVVMTVNAVPDYLYARRHTVGYPPEGVDMGAHIARHQVDYIVVRPVLQEWDYVLFDEPAISRLMLFMAAHPDCFLEAYQAPEHLVSVYRVVSCND